MPKKTPDTNVKVWFLANYAKNHTFTHLGRSEGERNPEDRNLDTLDRAKIISIRYLVALFLPFVL
eukprot:6111691-Pyramimonas_sp.AAC.1